MPDNWNHHNAGGKIEEFLASATLPLTLFLILLALAAGAELPDLSGLFQ